MLDKQNKKKKNLMSKRVTFKIRVQRWHEHVFISGSNSHLTCRFCGWY